MKIVRIFIKLPLHQASILMESTFAYAYRIDDDIQLYKTKNEIIEQIKRFPIIVTADGYFNINRPFLAGVNED